MERTILWAAVAAMSLTLGCRTRGTQELLERELRLQEDRIYELEGQLEDYRRLMCENGSMDGGTITTMPGDEVYYPSGEVIDTVPSGTIRSNRSSTQRGDSERTFGSGSGKLRPPVVEQAPTYKGPPEISPPDASKPEGQQPTRGASNTTSGPKLPLIHLAPEVIEPETIAPGQRTEATEPATHYGTPVAITLNRQLTTGYNNDDRHGDDGITVLIEPRDAEGRLVDAPGKISVVLIDPLLEGESQRVARWDIALEQAEQRIRPGAGIMLKLPWLRQIPRHTSLDVFVRFTTAEGMQLDADQSLDVNLLAMRRPNDSNVRSAGGEFVAPSRTSGEAPSMVRRANANVPIRTRSRTTRGDWTPYR